MVSDWSATGRWLVGDRSPTGRRPVASSRKEVPTRSPTSRRSVGNQSPISRRPTAKPSCDSSATSAIVMNFGRGEVAERLQCTVYVWLRLKVIPGEAGFGIDCFKIWVYHTKEIIFQTPIVVSCPSGLWLPSI